MKYKIIVVTLVFASLLALECRDNSSKQPQSANPKPAKDTVILAQGINSKGIGRFKDVTLTHPLNGDMVAHGQIIYNAKCFACHKLTTEKLVGPGWRGVTDRRTPEWIMNFITNTQVMLDKDLVAESVLVTCLVRMPNQDLSDEQAREMLEFMRKNDGKE